MKALRTALALACVLAFGAIAQPAGAAQNFTFSASFYGPNNNAGPTAFGSFSMSGKNAAGTLKVQLRHGADPPYFTYDSSPSIVGGYYSPSLLGFVPGDVIEVRMPANSPSPTEVYTFPAMSLNLATGSATITGSAPAGNLIEVGTSGACVETNDGVRIDNPTGGITRTLKAPLKPGQSVVLSTFSGLGDIATLYQNAPGETPCFHVTGPGAGFSSEAAPGSMPPAKPYDFAVYGLSGSVAPSVKLVHKRGGNTLSTTTSISYLLETSSAEPALPGDTFELYRPSAAATPSAVVTVPQISATFDPSVDLVAVDHPGLSRIDVYPCREFNCPFEVIRTAVNAPAGRTILDFSKPQQFYKPIDLWPTDRVNARAVTADGTISYDIRATVGDLAAPTQKISVASKLKLRSLIKALKKGLKIKLQSSEAGSANVALTLGKAKIASAKTTAIAGTETIKLKFTKSGKKALKKLQKKGRHFKSQKATLTSVVTDASGNASTAVAKTKIKR